MGMGVVLGIVAVLVVAVLAVFLMAGGPGRFMGSAAPNQTNVNVPAANVPAQPAPVVPQINIPPKIDVNLNQQPPQAPAGQAPAVQAPAEAPRVDSAPR